MGRPKIDAKPTVIRLPAEVLERIDALCGKNRRAEFIREAAERELKRRERKA
jgi:predicted DNA-binding protein